MFKQAKAGGRLGARDRGSWLRPLAFGVYLASVTGQPTSVRGGLMPTDMTERPYNFAWGQQTPQKKRDGGRWEGLDLWRQSQPGFE